METRQTKYPKLAQALNLNNDLYLKREDLNPYGSHKGRSIPVMINHYLEQDKTRFVISSSGNAALAAIKKIKQVNRPANLTIFIGKNIEAEKYDQLKNKVSDSTRIKLKQKKKPKQEAFQKGKKEGIIYLRQSTDDIALKGYKKLVQELSEIDNLESIFIPTSSGTTAQGVYEGFKDLNQNSQIHIVQTEYCHPIAEEFDQNFENKKESIAAAIVDRVAHRKQAVSGAIKDSNGSGWIVSDKKIEQVMKLVEEKSSINISPNSALSIAGIQKAKQENWKWDGNIAALICGN